MKKQMVRLGVTVGFIACAGAAGALGCFGSTSGGSSGGSSGANNNGSGSITGTTSGSASGSASTSGSGTASGASGSSTPSGTPPPLPAGAVVIDDMTMQQSVTLGSWYTYSDRTVPNSEPPILLSSSPPGSVTPTEGASFFPMMDSKGPTLTGVGGTAPTLWPYREAMGGGETTWGAGFGMDIVSALPDGGSVAFNACTNTTDASMVFNTTGTIASVGIPQPYDASQYGGIVFYATSFGTAIESVAVQIDDDHTGPWGGICDVCLNGGKCAAGKCPCSDSFIYTVAVKPGSWQQFTVTWAEMAQAGWSGQALAKGSIDTAKLYNIHFQLKTNAPKALANFDVGVAYVAWIPK